MQKCSGFHSRHDIKAINISQKSHKIYQGNTDLLKSSKEVWHDTKFCEACYQLLLQYWRNWFSFTKPCLQTDSKWINYFKEMRGNFSEVILKIVISWVRTMISFSFTKKVRSSEIQFTDHWELNEKCLEFACK